MSLGLEKSGARPGGLPEDVVTVASAAPRIKDIFACDSRVGVGSQGKSRLHPKKEEGNRMGQGCSLLQSGTMRHSGRKCGSSMTGQSGGRAKLVAAKGTVSDRLGCVVRGTILHEVVHCVIAQLPTVVGRTCALGGVGVKPAATLGRAENSTTS